MTPLSSRRILVVEDDRKIAELILNYLRADGFDACAIGDGQDAVHHIRSYTPDLVILDWMLPGLDGVSVCKSVRAFSDVPILMLTARIDELDRLLGLDTGADDYVCKPFSPREVMARVRALLRRSEGRLVASSSPWGVDEASFRINWRGEWLPLTRLEFLMLRLLLSRPGRAFSRAHLLQSVYDEQRDISDRAIDTHIKNLRRKIQTVEPSFNCITSIYGVGYRFDTPAAVHVTDT
jgi:two-component system, OmpR family, response regulator BaeR